MADMPLGDSVKYKNRSWAFVARRLLYHKLLDTLGARCGTEQTTETNASIRKNGQVGQQYFVKEDGKNSVLENFNDKFFNYINRVKATIRSTSNVGVGDGKSGLRLDSFNDRVGSFINRAKIKIRTVSNVGGGRSGSIK
ncbi:hypothetical protein ACSBR2_021179 [Camellia fascicularis]